MFGWLIRRKIDAYEKEAGLRRMGYARELLEADPGALRLVSKVLGIAQYRKDGCEIPGLPRRSRPRSPRIAGLARNWSDDDEPARGHVGRGAPDDPRGGSPRPCRTTSRLAYRRCASRDGARPRGATHCANR